MGKRHFGFGHSWYLHGHRASTNPSAGNGSGGGGELPAGAVVHLEARLDTWTAGASVTAVADHSGNGFNLQFLTGTEATYETDGPDSQAYYDGEASFGRYSHSASATFASTDSDSGTLILIARKGSNVSSPMFFGFAEGASSSWNDVNFSFHDRSSEIFRGLAGSTTGGTGADSNAFTTNTWHKAALRCETGGNGATTHLYVDDFVTAVATDQNRGGLGLGVLTEMYMHGHSGSFGTGVHSTVLALYYPSDIGTSGLAEVDSYITTHYPSLA